MSAIRDMIVSSRMGWLMRSTLSLRGWAGSCDRRFFLCELHSDPFPSFGVHGDGVSLDPHPFVEVEPSDLRFDLYGIPGDVVPQPGVRVDLDGEEGGEAGDGLSQVGQRRRGMGGQRVD